MLTEHLVGALAVFGLPVLFSVILLAAIGVPLPASLLLITAGALAEHSALDLGWVMGTAAVAVVAGDNIGYSLGRWGSPHLLPDLMQWTGGKGHLQKLGESAARWGGLGIFLTRWVAPPLGPAINLTSGIARYPWPSFFGYESLGALLWVLLYTSVGRRFSDRVQCVSGLLGTMGWAAICLAVVILVGWLIVDRRGRKRRGVPG